LNATHFLSYEILLALDGEKKDMAGLYSSSYLAAAQRVSLPDRQL